MTGSPDWLALACLAALLVLVIVVIPAVFQPTHPRRPTVALNQTAESALRRRGRIEKGQTLDDWLRERTAAGDSSRKISAELAHYGVVVSHVSVRRWVAAATEAAADA